MANSVSGHTLRLLFLVYINDLPAGLTRSAKLFADDMSMILQHVQHFLIIAY